MVIYMLINTRRLLQLRLENNYTTYELAKRFGVSQPHISKVERGKTQPSIEVLLSYAREFNCTLDDLVYKQA